MRKFMDRVAVKYSSITVWIVSYDYGSKLYTVADRQGNQIKVKEDELRYLTD